MPADPTPAPAPEWAVNAAKDYFGRPHVAWTKAGERGYFPDLARLLASVRDVALREAAGELSRIFLAKWERHGADFSPEGVMRDAVDATLGALVNTAPREAAPSSPRDEEAPHAR